MRAIANTCRASDSHVGRMGVRHVFLWILSSSVCYVLLSVEEDSDGDNHVVALLFLIWRGACDGTVLSGAIISLYWRLWLRQALLPSPGRVLLLVWSASIVFDYLPVAATMHVPSWCYLLVHAAVVGILAAYVKPTRWKVLFGGLAVLSLSELAVAAAVNAWGPPFLAVTNVHRALLQIQAWAPNVFAVIRFSMAIGVILLDSLYKKGCDWLHWSAIGIFALDQFVSLCLPSRMPEVF